MNRLVVRLRIDFAPGRALGPGKVGLLEAVARAGSLSAAATRLEMSYKRAWSLLQSTNELFGMPLVVMSRGGRGGGGAIVTDLGYEVIAAYRATERKCGIAAARAFVGLPAAKRPQRKGTVKRLSARMVAHRRTPAR
jgi:molybdate transport system regulatory protein